MTLRNRRFLRKILPISDELKVTKLPYSYPISESKKQNDHSGIELPMCNPEEPDPKITLPVETECVETSPTVTKTLEANTYQPRRSERIRVPRELFSAQHKGKNHTHNH